MVRNTVSGAKRRVEVVIGVVRINPLRRERIQLRVAPLLGPRIGQAKSGAPMSPVERVRSEHRHSAARAEAARAHMVGKRGAGGARQRKKQQSSTGSAAPP